MKNVVFIIWFVAELVRDSAADCSYDTPSVYTLGTECQYMCHCKNGAKCDTYTGECSETCAENWFGPACQYRDLAEGQLSKHSSNTQYPNHASKAVDGDITTCSTTIGAQSSNIEQWLRVWLPRNETIRDMYILTKNDRKHYFPGFEVTVEYQPEKKKYENNYVPAYKHICYQHGNTEPESEFIYVQCERPLVGNQIRIKLSIVKAQLVLCDVRIGQGRNVAFRKHATASLYDSRYPPENAVDGQMGSGVSTDWSGCFVSSDTSIKYLDVNIGSPMHAYSVQISTPNEDFIRDYQVYTASTTQTSLQLVYNGTGIMPPVTQIQLNANVQQLRIQTNNTQYQLFICELELYGECPANKCGYDCTENCYCKSYESYEHRINGVCTTGCQERWTGANGKCNTECDLNKWGTECQYTCGACSNGTCDFLSGECNGGCQDGYYNTIDCITECQSNTYGQNCVQVCSSNCINGYCSNINGRCFGGCKAGYIGDKCDQVCPARTYGINCNQACNANCKDICNHVLGTCTTCMAGWKGEYCNTECADGTYGISCGKSCDSRCINACDKISGQCSQCQPGWTGKFCETECENGTHGDGCTKVCGSCKGGAVCNKSNGTCIDGCADGFTGGLCITLIDKGAFSLLYLVVAGASSFGVVIAIVVIVAVICVRRRRRTAMQNKADQNGLIELKYNDEECVSNTGIVAESNAIPQDSSDQDNIECERPVVTSDSPSDGHSYTRDADAPTYTEIDGDYESDSAIMVKHLADDVYSKLIQQDFFTKEFQDIPIGLQHPYVEAVKPENTSKNRYKELYAYDYSRVALKTLPCQPDSDYINASYIRGYNKDKAYIATQGPTNDTIADFWRMIWENDVNLIVMITNLVENKKTKCAKYWMSVNVSKVFGKITVYTETEEVFADFTVRWFQIAYEGHDRRRHVVQYAYTAWPAGNVPYRTCSLVHFWHKVRKHDKEKSHPWLVHCSAGVGRTGTFIALDLLYDQGTDAGYVDINMCVRNLRDQRVNMVQTKEQYSYLYRLTVEALVLQSTPIYLTEFESHYTALIEDGTENKLKMQFESMAGEQTFVIGKVYNDTSDIYVDARIISNSTKNRHSDIITADEFRPFLTTAVPGTNDYINAVFMPNYRNCNGYLVTQTPLPDTAVDCCRLIIDQDIHVVVTFDDSSDNTVGVYLPTVGSIDVGPFKVTMNSEEDNDGYVIRRHSFRSGDKEQEVVQFDYKDWPLHALVPEKPEKMLQMLEQVDELQRQFGYKPVLAQCFNGADRSGLFVVLMNVIERATIEEEVSIPQVIRYLRTRRHIIPNFEQYKFCHDVCLCYTERGSIYVVMSPSVDSK